MSSHGFLAHFAACFGLLALCGCSSAPVAVPTSYDVYNAKDGSFKCEYPSGWESAGGGKGGRYWAKFTEGGVEIRVDVDVTGSLLGDIADSSNRAAGVDDEDLSGIAQVHELKKEEMAEKLGNYAEQPPVKIQPMLGEGRKSEFTASSTLGGGIHGYRATVLSRDRRITMTCRCPEAEWQALQATFDHTIDSLGPGSG